MNQLNIKDFLINEKVPAVIEPIENDKPQAQKKKRKIDYLFDTKKPNTLTVIKKTPKTERRLVFDISQKKIMIVDCNKQTHNLLTSNEADITTFLNFIKDMNFEHIDYEGVIKTPMEWMSAIWNSPIWVKNILEYFSSKEDMYFTYAKNGYFDFGKIKYARCVSQNFKTRYKKDKKYLMDLILSTTKELGYEKEVIKEIIYQCYCTDYHRDISWINTNIPLSEEQKGYILIIENLMETLDENQKAHSIKEFKEIIKDEKNIKKLVMECIRNPLYSQSTKIDFAEIIMSLRSLKKTYPSCDFSFLENPDDIIDYIIYQKTRQGIRDMSNWILYLSMSIDLYGYVENPFPENLEDEKYKLDTEKKITNSIVRINRLNQILDVVKRKIPKLYNGMTVMVNDKPYDISICKQNLNSGYNKDILNGMTANPEEQKVEIKIEKNNDYEYIYYQYRKIFIDKKKNGNIVFEVPYAEPNGYNDKQAEIRKEIASYLSKISGIPVIFKTTKDDYLAYDYS